MRIDKLAVWINTIGYRSAELVAFARRLEEWGYGTLWINDGMGSDPMVLAARNAIVGPARMNGFTSASGLPRSTRASSGISRYAS